MKMIDIMIIGIIILLVIIGICIYAIVRINNDINNFNSTEGSICPRFLCETTPCTAVVGSNVAYRYDSNGVLQCQTYQIDANVPESM